MAVTDDGTFAGSIAEIYDRYLDPLIFDSYALDLASRLVEANPLDVLETAAGTGVLTRAIRIPPSCGCANSRNRSEINRCLIAQRDGNLRMVEFEWKQADALALPFENQSFDVVACQFGVMFFPEKVQGYREAWRFLKPGGRFHFNVWDRISENEFADTITEALAAVFPHDPPRFLARTPHGYHDVECIRAEFNAAGFSDLSVDFGGH